MSSPIGKKVLYWLDILGAVVGDGVSLVLILSHLVSLILVFCMHRRRDHLGRFLPKFNKEDPFPKEEEELFENMFTEVPYQEHSPTTSKESLHLNNIFAEHKYQDNPLALVIY